MCKEEEKKENEQINDHAKMTKLTDFEKLPYWEQ
jgi:hypothetical protein